MKITNLKILRAILAVLAAAAFLAPQTAKAHCDGLDGPVVKAAQKALAEGNVNLVLIWVQQNDEAEIKHAFEKTLAVRKLNAEAKELADLYFFETLVRIHRAGEGAPYTGLKPAGRDLGPAIPASDKPSKPATLGRSLSYYAKTWNTVCITTLMKQWQKRNSTRTKSNRAALL